MPQVSTSPFFFFLGMMAEADVNCLVGYKVLQRIYKFGGQPYFNDYLTNNYKPWFQRTFGERNGKSMMSATAGR